MMLQGYSVLMSVYQKDQPQHFILAAESMFSQTIAPGELVLVCDGPLTRELEAAIQLIEKAHPYSCNILRLSENRGLGTALREGIKHCRYPLVARMDSDDLSLPTRCAAQLREFEQNDALALLSGTIAEFDADPSRSFACRRLPCTNQAIRRYAKRRNPMNHMAVMMKREAVLAAGNYGDFSGMEDYELWSRMLQRGFEAANLEQVLVLARIGNGFFDRRGGLCYAKAALRLQYHFLKSGFISAPRFLANCLIRLAVSLIPVAARRWFYSRVLRNKGCKGNSNESKTI